MGKVEKAELLEEVIEVQDEMACHDCGRINIRTKDKMSLDQFNDNAAKFPEHYWKEAGTNDTIIYRHYREHSNARCAIC